VKREGMAPWPRPKVWKDDLRGAVAIEYVVGFYWVLVFFFGIVMIADASAASLVVQHASDAAVRAAVVVLADDGSYYDDPDNNTLHRFEGRRAEEVEKAADILLKANPRLQSDGVGNVTLDQTGYFAREPVTAKVSARYRCFVPLLCGGGLTLEAEAALPYQGFRYQHE